MSADFLARRGSSPCSARTRTARFGDPSGHVGEIACRPGRRPVRSGCDHGAQGRCPTTVEQHGHYFQPNTDSLYNMGRVVDGHTGEVNLAEHSYDPWYAPPQDPEIDRDPTSGVFGSSRTQQP